MSLRKPYALSPATVAANCRDARKSTGPRSARAEAQSRLNRLREGSRSRLYQDLLWKFMDASPAAAARMVRTLMTPELAAHPFFGAERPDSSSLQCRLEASVTAQTRAEVGRIFCQAGAEVALTRGECREERNPQKDCFYSNEATKSMKTRRRHPERS